LVLGGTSFVGRHIVDAALARGHEVTVFNRGRTVPEGIVGVTALRGDREAPGGMAALEGSRWDLVLDSSCYLPRAARATAAALAEVGHYVLISSLSVYADLSRRPTDEASGVATPPDELDTLTPTTYGGLKVACERIVEARWPGRVTQVRAGLIVGPLDYDQRFPWLVRRVAAGGQMIGPGAPDRPVQLIDARDLAAWVVACAEARIPGVMNAVGPETPLPYAKLLECIAQVVGTAPRVTWVADAVLLAHSVAPYSELPFWLPADAAGPLVFANDRAQAAGLRFRPVGETIADVWRWLATADEDPATARKRESRRLAVPAGLAPVREREILSAAAAESAPRR
jgi:2'-hydroxyisoflavone reductase